MLRKRVNMIPMAGEGRRFVDAGYTVPKPLIDIGGKPMILRAASSLPPADDWVFICRAKHLDHHQVGKVLLGAYPTARIVRLDHSTEGQLCTCLLGSRDIDPNSQLQIGACDNGMIYDPQAFEREQKETDILIWTFRGNPAVKENPSMYGWVREDGRGWVTEVSCKIPISQKPESDHAVIGAFTFSRAADFVMIAEKSIAEGRRINGEFYVDEAINTALKMGFRARVFEVDQYVCWGTPAELSRYLEDQRG